MKFKTKIILCRVLLIFVGLVGLYAIDLTSTIAQTARHPLPFYVLAVAFAVEAIGSAVMFVWTFSKHFTK